MNRKSNHQNLLRTALTTAGTSMTRWAVTLAMVMMTTASALAETSYITDLMLIGKNDKSEAQELKAQYVEQGWTAIDQDLNAGCGSSSDYIYLLYKVGGLASANQSFITDIYITADKTSDILATRTIEGRQYNLVPYDGDNHFKSKKGDLNSNAGGADIHLYYTTDYLPNGKAISSIVFNGTSIGAVDKDGNNSTDLGYDLNSGTNKGDKIYMHCEINKAPKWIIEKSSDGGRCIIKGFEKPSGGMDKSEIKVFPSILGGARVVAIGQGVEFSIFTNLETIYFNEDFLTSEMISMNGCTYLQHVHTVDNSGNVKKSDELPSCITSIPKEGFSGCSALKNITIPASVTSIGDNAFKGCSGLSTITVDPQNPNYKSINGVLLDMAETTILYYPPANPTTTFVIPASMTSIAENTFEGCSHLATINVDPNNPNYTSIDGVLLDKAETTILYFPPANPTTTFVIPASVTSIAEKANEGCRYLKAIYVDNGNPNYISIDGVLLDKTGTTLLLFPAAYPSTNYVIPDGVTSIKEDAFSGRTILTSITFPGSMKIVGCDVFYKCTFLKSVTIENGVERIDKDAFYRCTNLTSINIPSSVTSIGWFAFAGTGLTSVTIPGSVESIGQYAFYECDALESISILGNPKICKDAIPDDATVTLSLTANDANGAKWMTFYNDRYNFQADENTTVYKATVVGQSLVLTEVEDKIVNGAEWDHKDDFFDDDIIAPATAVILKSTGNPVMTRTETESSDTRANDLVGTTDTKATPANCFTLASGPKGVGFYRYTGKEVAARKAYLIYNGASAAREFIGFDETTGIVSMEDVRSKMEDVWYSLDGRKLQGEPAKKGIYVRNGYTVIIK